MNKKVIKIKSEQKSNSLALRTMKHFENIMKDLNLSYLTTSRCEFSETFNFNVSYFPSNANCTNNILF